MSEQRMGLSEAREIVADWRFGDSEQQRIARTIVAVGEVLDRLDAAWKAKNQEQYSEYNEGYTDALDVAERWLEEALQIKDTE